MNDAGATEITRRMEVGNKGMLSSLRSRYMWCSRSLTAETC